MPKAVIAYDMPAELSVPSEVRKLAVIDRKGSKLSAAARLALEEELQSRPRYSLAESAPAQAALATTPSTVGKPLDTTAVAGMRKAAAADGILAIDQVEKVETWSRVDRIEQRTRIESRKPADCDNCEPVETEVTDEIPFVDATVDVTVTVGFQLYGADGALLDAWSEALTDSLVGSAETEALARVAAGDPGVLAEELAAGTAFEAARHIAPWTTSVERDWYAGGGPEVAAGAKLAKADQWGKAERVWREGKKTAEGDVEGRLLYNLAVAAERRGDIAGALKLLKEAKGLLTNTERAEAYQLALRERKKHAATLAAQMTPAE